MSNKWLEKELEDYTKSNIAELSTCLRDDQELELIGTQIPCSVGRIDMLCYCRTTLYVIEFKAVKATEKDLGQTIRYSSFLGKIVNPYQHVNYQFFNTAHHSDFSVHPVIVAPDFDKTLFLSNCTLISAKKISSECFGLSVAVSDFYPSETDNQNRKIIEYLKPFEKHVAGYGVGRKIWLEMLDNGITGGQGEYNDAQNN